MDCLDTGNRLNYLAATVLTGTAFKYVGRSYATTMHRYAPTHLRHTTTISTTTTTATATCTVITTVTTTATPQVHVQGEPSSRALPHAD